jgi:hypothetical protein
MLLFAALLLAQTAPCPAMDANLPAPLAVWTTAGHGSPGDWNKPVVLAARPKGEIVGLPAAARDGGATMLPVTIDKAGTYGVAIDQGAWIDVLPESGEALKSSKHGHGPECSTIRKVVSFDLQPGKYRVFVSGLTSTNVKVFLVRP